MKKYVIIVAGGSGSRMKSEIPKQFLPLASKPVLMHTIENYYNYDTGMHIIVVLPHAQVDRWKALCIEYSFHIFHQIVHGGNTRFQSVKKGLEAITDTDSLVAIHDGVRPLTSQSTIDQSFKTAFTKGNAVAAIAMKDSVRIKEGDHTKAIDRAALYIIQTPQTFGTKDILEAFNANESPLFTDDASVLEYAGHTIHLIEGSYSNIKITTPEDLAMAEALMKFGI